LDAEDAVVVAAQLADVSQRSAFSAGELAEGLTRVGGAFSTIQQANPAEVLEFLSAASNSAQTSVSRVSTALRQFSVNVAEGSAEIKEFANLDIADEGLLRGPQALIDVLDEINKFEGQTAAIDFITQFTDKRNASIILSIARNVESLRTEFDKLQDPADAANKAAAQTAKFFTAIERQSRTLTSELNKLRASFAGVIAESGIVVLIFSIVLFEQLIISTCSYFGLIASISARQNIITSSSNSDKFNIES